VFRACDLLAWAYRFTSLAVLETARPAAETSRPTPSTVLQAETRSAAAAAASTMRWRMLNNPDFAEA